MVLESLIHPSAISIPCTHKVITQRPLLCIYVRVIEVTLIRRIHQYLDNISDLGFFLSLAVVLVHWVPLKVQYKSFTILIGLNSFQLSQIWQMLRTIHWYDTCKISRQNSYHDKNGSGFCKAPLKCNFTT